MMVSLPERESLPTMDLPDLCSGRHDGGRHE